MGKGRSVPLPGKRLATPKEHLTMTRPCGMLCCIPKSEEGGGEHLGCFLEGSAKGQGILPKRSGTLRFSNICANGMQTTGSPTLHVPGRSTSQIRASCGMFIEHATAFSSHVHACPESYRACAERSIAPSSRHVGVPLGSTLLCRLLPRPSTPAPALWRS